MDYRKITAIVRGEALGAVEKRLREMGVKGVSVSEARGYGEYAGALQRDWRERHARIDIFTGKGPSRSIVEAILGEACSGSAGDGIIAVQPVESVYRIRTRSKARVEEL